MGLGLELGRCWVGYGWVGIWVLVCILGWLDNEGFGNWNWLGWLGLGIWVYVPRETGRLMLIW